LLLSWTWIVLEDYNPDLNWIKSNSNIVWILWWGLWEISILRRFGFALGHVTPENFRGQVTWSSAYELLLSSRLDSRESQLSSPRPNYRTSTWSKRLCLIVLDIHTVLVFWLFSHTVALPLHNIIIVITNWLQNHLNVINK
jgi:hypothetical protein